MRFTQKRSQNYSSNVNVKAMINENEVPTSTLTQNKHSFAKSAWTVVALIFTPFLGIVLLWSFSGWRTAPKVVITIIASIWVIIQSAVLILAFIFLWLNQFSLQAIIPQDPLATTYLREKYNEEFVLTKGGSSSTLGEPISYSKRYSPKNDTSINFYVRKCLSQCKTKQDTDFTDDYFFALWSKRESESLNALRLSSGLDGKAYVYTGYGKFQDDMIDDRTHKLKESLEQLSPDVRAKQGYNAYYLYEVNNLSEIDNAKLKLIINQVINRANELTIKSPNVNITVVVKDPSLDSRRNKHYMYSTADASEALKIGDIKPLFREY
ncbi:MAG: hypothetical protein JWN28_702 [Candidatus Saccharibacteria bacterium]|nr:hypothetical protein [Candidatus Saccharibacteria bacterium]